MRSQKKARDKNVACTATRGKISDMTSDKKHQTENYVNWLNGYGFGIFCGALSGNRWVITFAIGVGFIIFTSIALLVLSHRKNAGIPARLSDSN